MIYDTAADMYHAYLVAFRSQGVDGNRGQMKGGAKSKVQGSGGKGVIVSGCA
jgi:hypothetical protein|tara:strand:- start:493 stop:648 length:156 start_codon:yes stop_codon:yes gene_type:complete